MKFVAKDPIDIKSSSVQLMAWRRRLPELIVTPYWRTYAALSWISRPRWMTTASGDNYEAY